jgi:glycerol uptake facilitator-like aquaporin
VSLVLALRGVQSWREASTYILVQIAGCCTGAIIAHAMFSLPLIQSSRHARTGLGQWLGEFIATLGLLLIVLGHRRTEDAPWMIAGWIGAAYWFTSSTSFANPAITIARSLSNTFAGIAPSHVPGFILAQLLGALAAVPLAQLLFARPLRAS